MTAREINTPPAKDQQRQIFEPTVARDCDATRLPNEILSFFGGRCQAIMAQLAAGKLTREDIQELENHRQARWTTAEGPTNGEAT